MKGSFIIVLCVGSFLSACAGPNSLNLGARDGRLSPCPSRPNCVSSQSADPAHYVDPLYYAESAGDVIVEIKMIIKRMKRAAVIKANPTYLHVEFRSALFRFVDDVEFLVDEAERTIHVRSASRVGYSDLGVNRRRIERIRQVWDQRKSPQERDQ